MRESNTQPGRNGGTLNVGGNHNPSGKGGELGGRPRAEIRASLLALADTHGREYVEGVLKGEMLCPECKEHHEYRASEATVLRCAELSLKYGLGRHDEVVRIDDTKLLEINALCAARFMPEDRVVEYMVHLARELGFPE